VSSTSGRYTPVGSDLIPTGAIESVAGTPLDFGTACPIGDDIRDAHDRLSEGQGYDHNYVLTNRPGVAAAVLSDPPSHRTLEIHTDQPGLQLHTGNFFDGSHIGTSRSAYHQGDGVALETQHFPDSPHQPHFPTTVLRPGEEFTSRTTWRFTTSRA
jgi:aldose 1-epimerase